MMKTVVYTIRLNPEQYDKLKFISRETYRTKANVIRFLIERADLLVNEKPGSMRHSDVGGDNHAETI